VTPSVVAHIVVGLGLFFQVACNLVSCLLRIWPTAAVQSAQEIKEKVDHHRLKSEPDKPLSPLLHSIAMDPQPLEHNSDELFVYPWSAVVVNISYQFVGLSERRLKEHFARFHPTKVHTISRAILRRWNENKRGGIETFGWIARADDTIAKG
jgi:hypothetical protein